jgi:hypothetical protein
VGERFAAKPGDMSLDRIARTEIQSEVEELSMQCNLIHQNLVARLIALTLLIGCFAELQISAQDFDGKATTSTGRSEPDKMSALLHTSSWGMTCGQTARLIVVNPIEPSERESQQMLFVQVVLFDANGAVIAESDEIAIPPGEIRSVDFNRDAISLAGEPGSGRLQVRAQVRYRSFFLVDRTRAIGFPASLELIDNLTGQTQATGRWWIRLSRVSEPGL